jgi:hypothetical protein
MVGKIEVWWVVMFCYWADSFHCGLLDPEMKALQSFETLAQLQHRVPKDLNL